MVFLMAIATKGERDTGLGFNDPLTKKATNVLENLPSTIPNSLIYRYEDFKCNKIADGFYGEIFKVEHRKTGEIMVLKMNKPDLEIDCCTMIHEITLMSDLSHPNVIRFLGVCIADSRMHLLCEYINGGELEGLLLDYTIHLEWSTRLYLAKDIAEGMRYLHKQGVIHRDLTSKNCLIKERNGWRYGIVADLGLATEIQEQSIVGSPYNMAPELLRGEAYDEKADVFSYGIILCEIIGRVPADPNELPRTQKFGLDIEKFQHMTGDCPKEFLQTALCCCQMEPVTRPTFAETSKHLEFILVGYKVRPEIEEAMKAPAPVLQIPRSAEQHVHSPEIKHKNEPEKSGVEMNRTTLPPSNPPAIVISADASPPLNFRSAEKRRQSWIAGRYKLFNTATDDLLKNTPGKLKSFFHRALHIHTHFDPSKQKKVKDSGKQRSASQLKRFSLINTDENKSLVSGEICEISSSGSSNPSSSPNSPGGTLLHTEQNMMSSGSSNPSSSPNSPGSTFLHTERGIQMSNCSLDEVLVDGRCSPHNVHSDTDFLPVSNSHVQPSLPMMLEVTQACLLSQSPSVCGSSMIRCLDEANRPRCQSAPVFNDLNSETLRQTASHRDCEMNYTHSTTAAHIKEDGKLKNRKSPFRIFKRKGNKSKESE